MSALAVPAATVQAQPKARNAVVRVRDTALSGKATAVVDSTVYFIGGGGKLHTYDTAAGGWGRGPDLPWPAGSTCAATLQTAALGPRLFVCSGLSGKCAWLDRARQGQWAPAPDMILSVDHATCASDGHNLFVVGGSRQSTGTTGIVQIFDGTGGRWSEGELFGYRTSPS